MESSQEWRSRPVFITSTFKDMQAERDVLRAFVFPALEEWLARRRRHLEWIDLRIGIPGAEADDEATREMSVLRVCLDEVRRSRPFIICMLGDRYGWSPPAERMAAAATEAGLEADVSGQSVTELEIQFGILEHPEQSQRSLVFLRAPLPYDRMPPESARIYCEANADDPGALDRCERLVALKQRLRARIPERCFDYQADWDADARRVSGLNLFRELVETQLRVALETELGAEPSPASLTAYEAEALALADFVEERGRGFVGRDRMIQSILTLLSWPASEPTAWGLCTIGGPGTGKSAIFSEVFRRSGTTAAVVLAHASGASSGGRSIDRMLQHWILQLLAQPNAAQLFTYTPAGELIQKPLISRALAVDARPDEIDFAFNLLLTRTASRQRVIILIDSLDQMEGGVQGRFAWRLPKPWPTNVHLFVTTAEGEGSAALTRIPGISLLPVEPVEAVEAAEITRNICDRYHRKLDESVTQALLAKLDSGAASRNVLWLVLVVEALNLLDADDFERVNSEYQGHAHQRVAAFMFDLIARMPGDVHGLYRTNFARAGALFGLPLVRAFLGVLLACPFGLRDSDYIAVLARLTRKPLDGLTFANLRRLFRGQLLRRSGMEALECAHGQMRIAARSWLATAGSDEKAIHAALVDHLLTLPARDPTRLSTLVDHLLGSQDWQRTARYLADLPADELVTDFARRPLVYSLRGLTDTSVEDTVRQIARILEVPDVDNSARAKVADQILEVYYRAQGRCGLAAEQRILRALEICYRQIMDSDPANSHCQTQLSVTLTWMGHHLKDRGDLEGALSFFRSAITILEKLASITGNDATRQSLLDRATNMVGGIGDVLMAKGDFDGALACYRSFPQSSLPHERIGNALRWKSDFAGALDAWRPGAMQLQAELQQKPNDMLLRFRCGMAENAIGAALAGLGQSEAALERFRTGLALIRSVAERNPSEPFPQYQLAWTLYRIAEVLLRQKDNSAAITALRAGKQTLSGVLAMHGDNVDYQRLARAFDSRLASPSTVSSAAAETMEQRASSTSSTAGKTRTLFGWLFRR